MLPVAATVRFCLTALVLCCLASAPAAAQPATAGGDGGRQLSVADVIAAMVRVKTFINPDARTQETLGREREGSGVVIDSSGLVLTIGYLMVEAHAAELTTSDGRTIAADVVGYDHDTGFGLLRATAPLKVRPMALGSAEELRAGQPVIVAAGGGQLAAVEVAATREFAGYWEYLLERAVFTSPPVPFWSGAALVSEAGRLVGIGSLVVGNVAGSGDGAPGNMFVPIDLLPPILGELIGSGRVSGAARPWLGLTTHEIAGHLLVARVVPGGPADKAGIRPGDLVSGIAGKPVRSLPALYRGIWALGAAGTIVPVDIVRDGASQTIEVPSASRRAHLRLRSTF